MTGRKPLLGCDKEEIRELVTESGYQPFRAKQLYHWLYRRKAATFDEMHTLPAGLRELANERWETGGTHPVRVDESSDGTKKYLFATRNDRYIETAMIPEGERATLCISTQVGCRRNCTFCQTARQGFKENVSAGEIVNQYHSVPERDRITNIVYMGMGEPLDNVEATLQSIALFTCGDGYALPSRRITLSTVGIHPHLERFLDESDASLAISLHSPFSDERRQIMPVENAHPIEETVRLVRDRREDKERRVSFEYTMFSGVNDTARHVEGISKLLNGLSVRINLIPFHEIAECPLAPTESGRITEFAELLRAKGFPTSIRRSRGQDINAACGLLWTRHVRDDGETVRTTRL